jgi:hypothetical protein
VAIEEIRNARGLVLDMLLVQNPVSVATTCVGWTPDDWGLSVDYAGGMLNVRSGGTYLHWEDVFATEPGHDPCEMSLAEILEWTGMTLSPVAKYATALGEDGWQGELDELVAAARTLHRVNANLP